MDDLINGLRDRRESLLERTRSRRWFLKTGAMVAGSAAIVPLLAACGGDDDDDSGDDDAPTATTASGGDSTPAAGGESTPAGDSSPEAETPEAESTESSETAPTEPAGSSGSGKGGSLIHVRTSDSDSLDPQRTIAGPSWFVFSNIFDTLVGKNMDLEFEPIIAETFEISDDGLTYTFAIRDGMMFHDGTPVTAESVKFTFDRASNPDAPAQALSFISAYQSSELADDKTIVMTLSEPSAPFMSNIAVEYFGILSPDAVEASGDGFGKEPVGSGPWIFDEWLEGEQIRLLPNPDYVNYRSFVENKGAPLADELIFKVIPEASTQIAAMETGEANHIVLPTSEMRNFKDNDDFVLFYAEGGTDINYIEFATEAQEEWGEPVFLPPFDDLKVRQAVAYAVNAEEIVDGVLEGLADRNFGFMPTGIFAYDPAIEEFGYAYDPDKANQLLDEAGWTKSGDTREKDGKALEVTMWTYANPTMEPVVQVLQSQLGEVGITVKLEILEIGTLIARLPENAHNLDVIGVGWPEADILMVMSDFGWGVGNYNPTDYMELLTEARKTAVLDERKSLYFDAQKLALEDVMAVPIWTTLAVYMTSDDVKGFHLGPDAAMVWVDAWVED
jgi:peptide/nickel transport system substrate-binding protein